MSGNLWQGGDSCKYGARRCRSQKCHRYIVPILLEDALSSIATFTVSSPTPKLNQTTLLNSIVALHLCPCHVQYTSGRCFWCSQKYCCCILITTTLELSVTAESFMVTPFFWCMCTHSQFGLAKYFSITPKHLSACWSISMPNN